MPCSLHRPSVQPWVLQLSVRSVVGRACPCRSANSSWRRRWGEVWQVSQVGVRVWEPGPRVGEMGHQSSSWRLVQPTSQVREQERRECGNKADS
jgi:hypothetical protein